MTRSEVVTAWVGAGLSDDLYRPQIADTYTFERWQDVTGQDVSQIQPDPNAYTIEVVCEDSVLQQMDTDGVPILWSEQV